MAADGGTDGDGERTSPPETPAAEPEPRRRRRLTRHLTRHWHDARQVWEDPRSLGDILRGGLIRIWCARGGGFFGLGYLVTFVLMEVRLVVSEFESSTGVLDFITSQLLEYLFRLGIMSFVNVLLAFLWPLLLLEHLGGWGLLILPAAYLLFERLLRPGIESAVPELAQARRTKEARRAAKRAAAEAKRLAAEEKAARRQRRD